MKRASLFLPVMAALTLSACAGGPGAGGPAPSLAKRESERAGAIRAYESLNALGIARLEGGGTLVAGSCSAHVSSAEFFDAVRRAAMKSGRKFTELATKLHPADHPAGFKEADYLKVIYLKFA